MPGGGPSGSSGTGTGSTANVFTPPNQAGAASNYQNILQGLINAGTGPGGAAYPQANYLSNYMASLPPQFYSALDASTSAAGYAPNATSQDITGATNLSNFGALPLDYLTQDLANANGPAYGNLINQATTNPYAALAQTGAGLGANIGRTGANALAGGAGQIMGTAFDPQQALYNQTLARVTDQQNAANDAAGVMNTPYGASLTGGVDQDFDIAWQNQQLARQGAGLSSALAAYPAASGLATTSAAAPSNAYISNLGNILSFLNAQNQASSVGAATGSNLLGSAGGAFGQGANLSNAGINTLASAGALPYSTLASGAETGLQDLSQAVNIGNQQYTIPQQALQDLQSYLGLGQSASGLSGQLGNLGFNQTASAIGGGLAGANALIGNNGLLTSGLLGNATGLGALASGGADAGGLLLPGTDVAASTAASGGSFLDALPFLSGAGS